MLGNGGQKIIVGIFTFIHQLWIQLFQRIKGSLWLLIQDVVNAG